MSEKNELQIISIKSKPLKFLELEKKYNIDIRTVAFLETDIEKDEHKNITFKDMEEFYVFLDRIYIQDDRFYYKEEENKLRDFLWQNIQYNMIIFLGVEDKLIKKDIGILFPITFKANNIELY